VFKTGMPLILEHGVDFRDHARKSKRMKISKTPTSFACSYCPLDYKPLLVDLG